MEESLSLGEIIRRQRQLAELSMRQALGEVYQAMTEATITRRGRRTANGRQPGD
jgi:hypothetical protein